MTRTAVRRHVDVDDGRIVIRKIVVETEIPESSPAESCAPVAPAAAQSRYRGFHRLRAPRLREVRQSRDVIQH